MLRIQSGNPYMRGCIDNASSVARGGCVLTSADAAMCCKQLLLLTTRAIPGKDMLLLIGIAPIVPAVLTPPLHSYATGQYSRIVTHALETFQKTC